MFPTIRKATPQDLAAVLDVERRAFGGDDEADLVAALMGDRSARPVLSLLAFKGDAAVGHVLFTAVTVSGADPAPAAAILAPLAVVPEAQGRGIGTRLVERGLAELSRSGVALVFVLGHPGYYPRFGFEPAGRLGLQAPYPIAPENADAWMVRALREDVTGSARGQIACADTLARPE